MVRCPDCSASIDLDEDEVEEGEIMSCPECDKELEVVSKSPVQLNSLSDEDEDEDEEEELEEEDLGDAKILGGITLADLVALDNKTFSPGDFAEAERIGSLPLDDLLVLPDTLIKVPMLTTRRVPQGVETQYLWKPRVRDAAPLKVHMRPAQR